MRIEAYTQVQQLYQSQKVSRTQKTQTASHTDRLQISSQGKDFQTAKAAVAAAPDIREELTAPIKARIQNGTYGVDNVLNRDVNDLKLPNLITMLSARPAEQQALADSHDRLQAAVRGLKRVNEQNSELLNSALEMVEFEMNLLQASKAAPETANYNRGAYNAGNTMGVIDHGFDAKQ